MTANSKYSYGIVFAGQRSNDFGLDIQDKTIGMPAKNKITQTLPFSNMVLDLSAMYGGQTYAERVVKVTFIVRDHANLSKERLYTMWTQTVNWLMGPAHKVQLRDDIMRHYYYLGEVQKQPSWNEYRSYGKLSVEFTCYPFRINELTEGNDIWDDFNFDLDVAQNVAYQINGRRTITLVNIGISAVSPELVATAPLMIEINGQQYQLPAGTSTSPDLMLPVGETTLFVTGTGKLTVNWHKELI